MLIVGNGRLITRSETNPYPENGAVALAGEQRGGTVLREHPELLHLVERELWDVDTPRDL